MLGVRGRWQDFSLPCPILSTSCPLPAPRLYLKGQTQSLPPKVLSQGITGNWSHLSLPQWSHLPLCPFLEALGIKEKLGNRMDNPGWKTHLHQPQVHLTCSRVSCLEHGGHQHRSCSGAGEGSSRNLQRSKHGHMGSAGLQDGGACAGT